jgi:hypothetical protein
LGLVIHSEESRTITTGTINITVSASVGVGLVWAQVHMGDIDPNNSGDASMPKEMRVNGCSLLMSNTTAGINKQGSVLAARPNDTPFYNVTLS